VTTQEKKTLFIFLDEAGNLDFSRTGSKYWSLTAVCTFMPAVGRQAFVELLYSLASAGVGQECFHATEDRQAVRDEVFRCITVLNDFEIHCVIAEKCKAHPSLYRRPVTRKGKVIWIKDESPFYDVICRTLLKYIFKRWKFANADSIVVVLSSLFTNEKQRALAGTLKTYLKRHTKKPFHIYFHQTKSDFNCQIADYCGWAITINWERNEDRSWDLIKNKVQSVFEIFRYGTGTHY
jgi:hypothetical protein